MRGGTFGLDEEFALLGDFLGLGEEDLDALEVAVVLDEVLEDVVLVVLVAHFCVPAEELEFGRGQLLLGLLLVLHQVVAVELDLHPSIRTFLMRIFRYIFSR